MSVLNLDSSNTENVGTKLTTSGVLPALWVENPNGVGLIGSGYSVSNGFGVWGAGYLAGVLAYGGGAGVTGTGGYAGVQGDGFVGILGDSAPQEGTSGPGVWGYGRGTWPAVEGYSFSGNGVRGVSVSGARWTNVGVLGYSSSGIGVVGITGSPSGYAGYFIGDLFVTGNKHAAVPHPDGSHRLLYAMESPESWFEDFGRAKLVRGRAKVSLDKNFAALVRTNDYHVFLSAEGETNGLYVSRISGTGFEVRERQHGTSNSAFSYRVVARRKDVKAPRLRKVQLAGFDRNELRKQPKEPAELKPTRLPKVSNRPQLLAFLQQIRRHSRRIRQQSNSQSSKGTSGRPF